ncbi:hypothetical protein D9619_007452 [Psilocybe cf. subviscida]|uniref:Uncharacterized protein n=1 Tax=Psilocybe cf. subviscida TaxID=2480587 RepID=A0A8H5B214_9AGAR|nr:hypothetical protein D9619_007452 [Psilocybe cf. subviscida]
MSSTAGACPGKGATATSVIDTPPAQKAVFRDITCTLPNTNDIRRQATPMTMKGRENKSVRESDKRQEDYEAEARGGGIGSATERKTEIERVGEGVVCQNNIKGRKPRFDKENESPTSRNERLETRVKNASNRANNNAGPSAPGGLPQPRRVAQRQDQAVGQFPEALSRKAEQEKEFFREIILKEIRKAEDEVMEELLGDSEDK